MKEIVPPAPSVSSDERGRPIVTLVVCLAVLAAAVGVRAVMRDDRGGEALAGEAEAGAQEGDLAIGSASSSSGDKRGTAKKGKHTRGVKGQGGGAATDGASSAIAAGEPAVPGAQTALPGVTDDEIDVVYYWKGDRTRSSPYLRGTGAEGNVDEAEAFRNLIAFINNNADGGATLMGQPINLHGRRLNPIVVEAGQNAEDYAAAAELITKEIKPMVAIAAHGSISAYLCPALAAAGIHNLATYDLVGDLAGRSNGYCLPSGMTWEKQVELSEGYLLRQQRQDRDRVYGVVYAEYPGLVDSAPRMIERFQRAGLNIAEVASVSPELATAQQQAPNVVARMVAAGVNTIVMPDAGAPLNFTHAAAAQNYNPDYFVWPCSGQDSMGMVRLFNPSQWNGADGLTCYDQAFGADLTHNDAARRTQWYRAYRSQTNAEPPSPTPYVYAALLPLIAGLEGAGPNLTVESFRASLDRFRSYRYDAVDGRTKDGANMLLGLGTRSRGMILDAIPLRYDSRRREAGSSMPGSYEFPDRRRYNSRSDFR